MTRILISAVSGLIGSALVAEFRQRGDEVVTLVRRTAQGSSEREWHPEAAVPREIISGFDAVIHLSGESVAGRWNEAKKLRIRDSRVITTENLTRALVTAAKKPAVFICASAIGYYGNRGDEVLIEESPAGEGFFPELCREWEAATDPARAAGIRVANLRTGIVLSRDRGAFKQMLLPFRLGLGGKIGDGRQWWSWIHVEDFVAGIVRIVKLQTAEALSGPVNMVAPKPVMNCEFMRTLARAVHRPAVLPMPAFAARLVFGEFADEGLLASARVMPAALLANGFEFRYFDLSEALTDLLRTKRID